MLRRKGFRTVFEEAEEVADGVVDDDFRSIADLLRSRGLLVLDDEPPPEVVVVVLDRVRFLSSLLLLRLRRNFFTSSFERMSMEDTIAPAVVDIGSDRVDVMDVDVLADPVLRLLVDVVVESPPNDSSPILLILRLAASVPPVDRVECLRLVDVLRSR